MQRAISFVYEKINEEWKIIDCYNIIPNKYEISTCGNIRRIKDKFPIKQQILKNEFGVYNTVHLQTIYSGSGTKTFLTHRILAETYIKDRPANYIQVNHIDNNGLFNSIYNIEWCTPEYNSEYVYNNNYPTNLENYKIYCLISEGKSDNEILQIMNMECNINNLQILRIIRISYDNNQPSYYDMNNITHNSAKFSNEQVHNICKLIQEGKNYREIANIMNIDISDKKYIRSFNAFINNIKRRKHYTHISQYYNW